MSDDLQHIDMPLKFGQYKLLRRIKKDPIGELYLALLDIDEKQIEKRRFIRIIDPSIATHSMMRLVLEGEASIPPCRNLIPILQHGFTTGIPFLAYAYIEGVSVSRLVRLAKHRQFVVPWEIATYIAVSVFKGLQFIHELKDGDGEPVPYTHGNVCPDNILIGKDGVVKLGFSNSSFYEAASDRQKIEPFPDFFTPDIRESGLSEIGADLRGAAAVLWMLLSGKQEILESADIICTPFSGDARPPDELCRFLTAALSSEKEHRFQDARTMVQALEPILANERLPEGKTAAFLSERAEALILGEEDLIRDMAPKAPLRHFGGRRVDSDYLRIGSIIDDRYEIIESLGKGGMGEVFKVKDLRSDVERALKVLNKSDEPDAVNRFLSEARLTSSLKHRHIVDVVDAGIYAEAYRYIVMELLIGQTLKSFIDSTPLEKKDQPYINEIVHILLSVCGGIKAAHDKGIVHRDLKPSNIFLHTDPGQGMVPKILDFGIAMRLGAETADFTKSGEYLGTAEYSSPEQIRGNPVDRRADVYSLGMTLYNALTGTTPFRAERTEFTMARAIAEDFKIPLPDKVNPHVSEGLSHICMRSIKRDEKKRFQNIQALADKLRSFDTPNARAALIDRWKYISRMIAITAVIALPAGLGLNLFLTIYHRDEKSLREELRHPSPSAIAAEHMQEARTPMTARLPLSKEDRPPTEPSPSSIKTTPEESEAEEGSNRATEEEVHAQILLGRRALDEQRYRAAKEHFSKALSLSPRHPEALFGLGEAAFQQAEHRQAIAFMNKALSYRDNPEWRIMLGQVYMISGDRDAAVREWQTVIKNTKNTKTQHIAQKLIDRYKEKVE